MVKVSTEKSSDSILTRMFISGQKWDDKVRLVIRGESFFMLSCLSIYRMNFST